MSSGDVEKRPVPVSTQLEQYYLKYSLNITPESIQSNLLEKESGFWTAFIPAAIQSVIEACEHETTNNVAGTRDEPIVATYSGLIRGTRGVDSGKSPGMIY